LRTAPRPRRPKRLAFDLTISDQSASGALTGGFSADQLGTFAFQGSKHGSKVELIVAGENGGAGVLFVTLSRNGKALNGRWSSTIGSQQITGEVRALAGGTTVSAPDSPATIGQTASGPFVQTFNGTAEIGGSQATSSAAAITSATPASSTTAPSNGTVSGSTSAITGAAGAIPIANSTGAIAGATGAIAPNTGAISGSTGAITGATGAITGMPIGSITAGTVGTGAITGSTGAITGSTGAITGATGAITGSTGAITGGIGAIAIAGSTGAITGVTGSLTGPTTSLMGLGPNTGTATSPATSSSTTTPTNTAPSAAPTPVTQSQPVVLNITGETSDGLITGSLTIGGTVFNFDGFISRNHFDMVLSGEGAGLAQGTLGRNRSVFHGTFAIQSGPAPMTGSFSAKQ